MEMITVKHKAGRHKLCCHRIVLFTTFILIQYCLYGSSSGLYGMDAKAFYQMKDSIMNSIYDVLQHSDEWSKPYQNDLLKTTIMEDNKSNTEREMVLIKDVSVAKLIYFLGYIAGIDLEMGNGYHYLICSSPHTALERLYKFYSELPPTNIYVYWLTYNLFELMSTNIYSDPIGLELITTGDDDVDKYAKEHPNKRFSKDVFMSDNIGNAFNYLQGILKSQ